MIHVVIVGQMGVGKSTLGRALAARVPYRDSDAEIEASGRMTGLEYADIQGVEALHALEKDVLLDRLAEEKLLVISAAGSMIASMRPNPGRGGCGTRTSALSPRAQPAEGA